MLMSGTHPTHNLLRQTRSYPPSFFLSKQRYFLRDKSYRKFTKTLESGGSVTDTAKTAVNRCNEHHNYYSGEQYYYYRKQDLWTRKAPRALEYVYSRYIHIPLLLLYRRVVVCRITCRVATPTPRRVTTGSLHNNKITQTATRQKQPFNRLFATII